VDRGRAPANTDRSFAGIRADLLVGTPATGGCGVMPLQQHITARHARWALRLLHGGDDTPWVQVAQCLLAPGWAADPALWRARIILDDIATSDPARRALQAPLARLAAAVHALPPWQVLQDAQAAPLPAPGPWCATAPLWCNPQLTVVEPQTGQRRGLAAAFAGLARLGTIHTVKDAITALAEVEAAWPQSCYLATAHPFWMRSHPAYHDRLVAIDHLKALVNAIPQSWRDAAAAATTQQLLAAPATREVQLQLWSQVGWAGAGPRPVDTQAATVKQLTQLQLGPVQRAREDRWGTFLEKAGEGAPPGQAPTVADLQLLLRKLWRLRWDNERKEVLWRLVLDGLPTTERMPGASQQEPYTCACGVARPGRVHHFWECPVAQAVVHALQGELPQLQQPLLRMHVWVARAPLDQLHKGVWRVVALAALNAMDTGRKLLFKWHKHPPQQPGLQTQEQQVQVASAVAVASLWDLLTDFVELGLYHVTWKVEVAAGHPFIQAVPGPGPGGFPVLRVRPPVAPQ
jgi:hypothetical protein